MLDMVYTYDYSNAYILINANKRKKVDQLSYKIDLSRQCLRGFTSRKWRNSKHSILSKVRLSYVGIKSVKNKI